MTRDVDSFCIVPIPEMFGAFQDILVEKLFEGGRNMGVNTVHGWDDGVRWKLRGMRLVVHGWVAICGWHMLI